jgi:hypothetical protein
MEIRCPARFCGVEPDIRLFTTQIFATSRGFTLLVLGRPRFIVATAWGPASGGGKAEKELASHEFLERSLLLNKQQTSALPHLVGAAIIAESTGYSVKIVYKKAASGRIPHPSRRRSSG